MRLHNQTLMYGSTAVGASSMSILLTKGKVTGRAEAVVHYSERHSLPDVPTSSVIGRGGKTPEIEITSSPSLAEPQRCPKWIESSVSKGGRDCPSSSQLVMSSEVAVAE